MKDRRIKSSAPLRDIYKRQITDVTAEVDHDNQEKDAENLLGEFIRPSKGNEINEPHDYS